MPFGLNANFYTKVLPLVAIETGFFWYGFTSDVRTLQVVLGLVGLWWCFAALWVEIRIEQAYPGFQYDKPMDPQMKAYKPFCDFAPWAACSKVLMSPPGRFLRYFGIAKPVPRTITTAELGLLDRARGLIDVPNPTLGVLFFACHLFYPVLLLIPWINRSLPWLLFAACCFVGCMTLWLAHTLFFVLKDFCIVCASMYVANFALIPMMLGICRMGKSSFGEFEPFFGSVPAHILWPFLALDAAMGIGVVWLHSSAHAHAP